VAKPSNGKSSTLHALPPELLDELELEELLLEDELDEAPPEDELLEPAPPEDDELVEESPPDELPEELVVEEPPPPEPPLHAASKPARTSAITNLKLFIKPPTRYRQNQTRPNTRKRTNRTANCRIILRGTQYPHDYNAVCQTLHVFQANWPVGPETGFSCLYP
jgi:hypothetical protein